MTEKNIRHPVRNFFIKRTMQQNMILKIFFTVLLSAVLTTAILCFFYNFKSHSGSFYYMSNDVMQDLELQSILGVILPPLITAETIGILIAFGIGLFSSRKLAVPLYKVEAWAKRLRNGKLNTVLTFRKEDDMRDMVLQCNGVTDYYRSLLIEVKSVVDKIETNVSEPDLIRQNVQSLKESLSKLEL